MCAAPSEVSSPSPRRARRAAAASRAGAREPTATEPADPRFGLDALSELAQLRPHGFDELHGRFDPEVLVAVAVRLEPVAVVVSREVAQERHGLLREPPEPGHGAMVSPSYT